MGKESTKRRRTKGRNVFTMSKRKKCPKWFKLSVTFTLVMLVSIIAIALFYSLTPLQQAKGDLKRAQESESKGETMAAISHYRDALKGYQAAGDRAGEEGVKLQIQYLESLPK